MTTDIERQLVALLEHDAARALDGADLLTQVQRRQAELEPPTSRRWPMWVASAAVVVITSVAILVAFNPGRDSADQEPRENAATNEPAPRTIETGRALPDSGLASCAYEYSLDELSNRTLAFDGTVVAIGDGLVVFDVNEAFAGVDSPQITVQMASPSAHHASGETDEFAPRRYSVGTRFLVSGVLQLHSGGRPFVWGCGFTRYWDEQTASTWRSTF